MKLFNTKLIVVAAALAVMGGVAATALHAGTEVKDEIIMNNPAYEKHTKAIVTFTHKKHVDEYKATCGECHHDKDNKPLTELKAGDNVQNCIECHKNPGKAKSTKDKKLTDKEKREFHADAIHDNCIECHKTANEKKTGKKTGGPSPTKCDECHPKAKK
jgi:hypothetical protein